MKRLILTLVCTLLGAASVYGAELSIAGSSSYDVPVHS
jgi:hypothetical protein